MAMEVRRKPGRIARIIGLKFGQKLRVINHVKAFGKVEEAEKGEFLAVGGGKNVVNHGKERCFG